MKTPIFDFAKRYHESSAKRLHMPGHKGKSFLGCEHFDITEINGADSLFEAGGIIRESEENASSLFESHTFYSTEGSSLCIRAMVYLLKLLDEDILVFAARNVHKAFISACALNDVDVEWIFGKNDESYLSCDIDEYELENALSNQKERKKALYITSPDYLGDMADIKRISEICRRHDTLLIVDNAHGAYLKFTDESYHPIDLGADMCCDSAHKTLPVLTGGAYLHISGNAPYIFKEKAKDALALFASTSPSYLILESLDLANAYIENGYKTRLDLTASKVEKLKSDVKKLGFELIGNEKLKLTVATKGFGYFGFEVAKLLEQKNVICEFSDRDFVVLMFTPENDDEVFSTVFEAFASIKKREPIPEKPPMVSVLNRKMSIREAIFSKSELVDIHKSEGRVLSQLGVSCPPAVPIAVCGEVIDKTAIECFEYYGIDRISVVKEIL